MTLTMTTKKFNGVYELLEEFGASGGLNNLGIYRVKCPETGKSLILKEVHAKKFNIEAALAMKLREFPNIVKLHDYVPHKPGGGERMVDSMYFEDCRLGSLEKIRGYHYRMQQKIPESFIWHVLLSIARALEACHTGYGREGWMPIVHGDVHRGNILLTFPEDPSSGMPEVKLCDFGTAMMSRHKKYQKDDVAGLAFAIFDLCTATERYDEFVVNDLADRVENGTFGYSEEMVEVLLELLGYHDLRLVLDAGEPISELVPWIEELSEKADMQEYGGSIFIDP